MAKLILIRHGDALHPAEAMVRGISEEGRPLTEFGRAQALETGKKIAMLGVSDSYIAVASPYKRAQQTLSIITEPLRLVHKEAREILALPLLTPDADPVIAATNLKQILSKSGVDLIVVCHLPIISEIFQILYSEQGDANQYRYDFSTAEFRVIQI